MDTSPHMSVQRIALTVSIKSFTRRLSTEIFTNFSLFRNAIFKEGDATIAEIITNAQDSIDLLQANFPLDLICALNVLVLDFCTINDAPECMNAVVDAIKNGARVRVLVETSGMNGFENRIAIKTLEDELLKRGLEDQIEFRFFPGRVHAKAINLDNEFMIIGSQNLHYSAWGEGGLAEFNAGTNNPRAVDDFRRMYEFYWERGLPADDTNWTPNSP